MSRDKIVVLGAGGFVGGYLVEQLAKHYKPKDIIAVSSRPLEQWLKVHPGTKHIVTDLRDADFAYSIVPESRRIFNLAAKVGGIGYIQGKSKVECLLSSQINTNFLRAISEYPLEGFLSYFYASSACVYPNRECVAYKETDAYPAAPSAGYGWEKLFGEQMCMAFADEHRIPVRIGRYHTIYGPGDDIKGAENRDHAPAALARKVIRAKIDGRPEIAIWGDGNQVRNFTHVDDIVDGTIRLCTTTDYTRPVNIGSSEAVTINRLVDILENIAGVTLERFYNASAPVGLERRNSDNTLIRQLLDWEPRIRLEHGMRELYNDLWNKMFIKGK